MGRYKKGRGGGRVPSADMSLPPELRGRKKTAKRVGGTPRAQMSHASSAKARKKASDGERRMRRDRDA